MKALTLFPEWNWAVCYLNKDVENRVWAPPLGFIGQRFALHSGVKIGGGSGSRKSVTRALYGMVHTAESAGWHYESTPFSLESGERVEENFGFDGIFIKGDRRVPFEARKIVCGAVVATAIVDHIGNRFVGGWNMSDQYHWYLRDVFVLEQPVPCKGVLGLWNLPSDVYAEVERQQKGFVTVGNRS